MRRRDCLRNSDTPIGVCLEIPPDDNEVLILECRASVQPTTGTRLGIARELHVGY